MSKPGPVVSISPHLQIGKKKEDWNPTKILDDNKMMVIAGVALAVFLFKG